jgi:hypothetical protein
LSSVPLRQRGVGGDERAAGHLQFSSRVGEGRDAAVAKVASEVIRRW